MCEEINKLIMEEDKRNPWTDEELAGRLHVAREYVTQIRRELGIPDSRDRRKQCLLEAAARILQEEPDISERQMTDRLNRQGFSVGKYVVGNCVRQLREARGGEREKTVRPSAAPFRSAPASPANPLPQSAVSTPGTISAPNKNNNETFKIPIRHVLFGLLCSGVRPGTDYDGQPGHRCRGCRCHSRR